MHSHVEKSETEVLLSYSIYLLLSARDKVIFPIIYLSLSFKLDIEDHL